MPVNIKLTKKKKEWLGKRKVILHGEPLNYNSSIQEKYIYYLKKLVKEMVQETNKKILKLFKNKTSREYFTKQKEASKIASDASISSESKKLTNKLMKKFNSLFSLKSKKLAEKMIDNTEKYSKSSLHSSLSKLTGGLSIKTGIVNEGTENVIKAIIEENVSLIKSLPQEYYKNITGAVMRSITSGSGIGDLIPEIKKYGISSEKRAKNIALDQTRKAYNSVNKQKLQSVGVKKFIWMHSYSGAEPRKSHIKIDGDIFSFENLENEQAKLGVPEKDRGLPGYPINCHCKMKPVIDFTED